jgi:hypothetical protein
MPKLVLNKIKYLCRAIPTVEWSGVLFYKFIGTIKNPKRFRITLVDILPMNKGNKTYTEYEFGPEIPEYIMGKKELNDLLMENKLKYGHIHSHNTMNVFFSNVDLDEINDNSEHYPYYLSLIVNNYMDFCAKIAIRGKINIDLGTQPFIMKDDAGEDFKSEFTEEIIVQRESVFVYDTIIYSNKEKISVDETFADNVNRIINKADTEEKEREEKRKQEALKNNTVKGSSGSSYSNKHNGSSKLISSPKPWWQDKYEEYYTPPVSQGFNNSNIQDIEEVDAETIDDIYEKFTIFILNFGSDKQPDDIEEVLAGLVTSNMTTKELCKSIIDNLLGYYKKFFNIQDKDLNRNAFIYSISEVVQVMEEYEREYPLLNLIIGNLNLYSKEFINDLNTVK